MDITTERLIYERAEAYWENQDSSVSGMLGGQVCVSDKDLSLSREFLMSASNKAQFRFDYALDCGAGVGRISKHLLLTLFEKVDLVDVVKAFLDKSYDYLGQELGKRVGDRFCSGLQDFDIPKDRYDVIWCQWVLSHLSRDDLIDFLRRAKAALREGGVIFVKENVCSTGDVDFDDVDNSWTRSRAVFLDVFRKAGLMLLSEQRQTGFPKQLYKVRMFALQ